MATSPCPAVTALVAYQATHGLRVTSLRHQTFEVNEGERELLGRLDGSRDRSALLAIVKELIAVQGKPADIGGYYQPDDAKASAALRPSQTLNMILASV